MYKYEKVLFCYLNIKKVHNSAEEQQCLQKERNEIEMKRKKLAFLKVVDNIH